MILVNGLLMCPTHRDEFHYSDFFIRFIPEVSLILLQCFLTVCSPEADTQVYISQLLR
jgi:hypothetical protein